MTLDASDIRRADAISADIAPATIDTMQQWADACGVPLDAITGYSRARQIVAARHGLMWVLRYRLGLSYPQIAKAMRRDHSTVIYGVRSEDAKRAESETPASS